MIYQVWIALDVNVQVNDFYFLAGIGRVVGGTYYVSNKA